jgi:hypothetical protein
MLPPLSLVYPTDPADTLAGFGMEPYGGLMDFAGAKVRVEVVWRRLRAKPDVAQRR